MGTQRRSTDSWAECACGSTHWGLAGAAGLLIWRGQGDGAEIVLQHRAHWSHFGGTWGIPGGAIDAHETPAQGALREAVEEAGITTENVRVGSEYLLTHPDWHYTTVVAQGLAGLTPRATDAESQEVRWVPVADLEAGKLELLPAFAAAWPELRQMLRPLVVVVDGANVMGARPDGWWRDRRGAATRLAEQLARLTAVPAHALDLPGHRWFPQIVLVTEGQARGAAPELAAPHLRIVAAPGAGDDEIVRQVARARAADGGQPHVVVVTADRGLRRRISAEGAGVLGPGALWRLLDETP